ncbi:MAG: hypothetical protein ACQES4_02675 [Bacillota bacterium]
MDSVIINGRIVDFRNRKFINKNVGFKNGKIDIITDIECARARIIDAEGLITAPGFIDIHSHLNYNYKINNSDTFETAKHLFLMGVTTALKMIDKAITEGVNLTADAYPYNAFCTSAGSTIFTDGCFKRWNIN